MTVPLGIGNFCENHNNSNDDECISVGMLTNITAIF